MPTPSQQVAANSTERSHIRGPAAGVHVEAEDGKKNVDTDARFTKLPVALKGADNVQLAAADPAYSAVDLIEIAVKAGVVVSIEHDGRCRVPPG